MYTDIKEQINLANLQYVDSKGNKFLSFEDYGRRRYHQIYNNDIMELKICIEQVFDTNKVKFQLLFDEIYKMLGLLIDNDYQYVLKTIKKLHEIGMKFYWHHLFHNCFDNYIYGINSKNVFVSIDDIFNYNRYILSFGIENPNEKLYEPLDSLYPPLFCLIKKSENISLNGGFNILIFYKNFKFDIDEIGCNPRYEHCCWYDTMELPSYLEQYINKNFIYTEEEIKNANMDFYIDEKLFASEHGFKHNEYKDNKQLSKILKNNNFYFDKIQSKEVNLALCRLIYEINKTYGKL